MTSKAEMLQDKKHGNKMYDFQYHIRDYFKAHKESPFLVRWNEELYSVVISPLKDGEFEKPKSNSGVYVTRYVNS